jgi:hypothetical protein
MIPHWTFTEQKRPLVNNDNYFGVPRVVDVQGFDQAAIKMMIGSKVT